MKNRTIFLFASAFFVSGAVSLAAEPKSAAPAKEVAEEGSVIDFEAEVIEGERLKPEIFVQMGSKEQQMSPVLYLRRHFNDFHASDRKWRPGYFEASFYKRPAVKGRPQK